ncbi:hypothetical protein OG429_36700 [Streptomyces sp. NBC_00190]|uniref:hypothetical protein n=1 Tax=unclassified Streptomyces TaxID=2593676 RepID=UPI002E2E6EEA|nr:hypothetical protein [Streptomyces sp. NBC_00190]WSZ44322.1 hypothetical protein OG239_39165 [Streptomyces sp. NBC_00868]
MSLEAQINSAARAADGASHWRPRLFAAGDPGQRSDLTGILARGEATAVRDTLYLLARVERGDGGGLDATETATLHSCASGFPPSSRGTRARPNCSCSGSPTPHRPRRAPCAGASTPYSASTTPTGAADVERRTPSAGHPGLRAEAQRVRLRAPGTR